MIAPASLTGMDAIEDNEDQRARPTTPPPVPDALVAGDWTVLSGLALAVAGLLFWRRRRTVRGR